MKWLKTYSFEHEEYGDLYGKLFTSKKDVEKVFRKLCRHFIPKAVVPEVLFTKSGSSGSAQGYAQNIKLSRYPEKICVGTLAHEFTHIFSYWKFMYMAHDKKHKKLMERVCNYLRKKQCFNKEVKYKDKFVSIDSDSSNNIAKWLFDNVEI